jgi:sulfane dehydrogenase subunit SoxC
MAKTAAEAEGTITLEELQLAARNHGMPLEALRWPLTPVGLHYLLTHFDIPAVEGSSWHLTIGGLVDRPVTLTLDDLRARPAVTLPVTFECTGNGRARLDPRPISQPWLLEAVGTAAWTGTPLRPLLEEAGISAGAVDVVFTGLDRGIEGGIEQDYRRSLPVEEALRDEVLLAYAIDDRPLPPQHGFPLRLVVPGWYGMTNVKWLAAIDAVAEPFQGYQQAVAYRLYGDDGSPLAPYSRMKPRALMVPPGVPEFMSRRRFVDAGRIRLEGRAWSGWDRIAGVEVSTDGGGSWSDADLGDAPSRWAWTGWTFDWDATPGDVELCCRATDAAGNRQPDQASWNPKGYANNEVQRIPVTVRGA